MPAPALQTPPRETTGPKLWWPKRVLVTAAALEHAHGRRIAARCEAQGLDVVELPGNRLTGLRSDDPREAYRRAKQTLAVVAAPPSARKLQPIPPSADFRLDLARGCPAHCQYCYLAGSLPGAPVTRVYGDLDELLEASVAYEGEGTITSRSAARAGEGTTFEASCYTDPLALEHLTGSVARAVEHFAGRPDAGLRFTTKFDDVEALAGLEHGGRTRARFSVNAPAVARTFEGGTAPVPARLAALGRLARAGYPVGLTVAPIMPVEGWEAEYAGLFEDVAAELADVPDVDLTVELITHRFTDTSRDVLREWYPASVLEMDEERRTTKRGKFGARKHVYPRPEMKELEATLRGLVAERLPGVPVLYFT